MSLYILQIDYKEVAMQEQLSVLKVIPSAEAVVNTKPGIQWTLPTLKKKVSSRMMSGGVPRRKK
ncbi:MAG: hypothetical protein F6K24_44040 [Okeania sp. SIO2D1]|nr:hypothetical protein [Okeania sp. SIO2D1]